MASITREGCGPQTHAYDDPDLSPIEFLQLVYRDPLLPMSLRIDAARGLLPYTEPRPASAPSSHVGCTIVIGGIPDPDRITADHSQNPLPPNKALSHGGEPGDPQNLTTIPEPPSLPGYSTPPTPAELQEIKAAINRLRPDLAHLPVPEPHLCACGHWIFGPCPLGEQCCDRTKLNREEPRPLNLRELPHAPTITAYHNQ